MRKTSYIFYLFVVICLLTLNFAYCQNKKQVNKTLFGKQKKIENVNPNSSYIRCVTTEYEKFLQEKNPKRSTNAQFENWFAPLIKQYKTMRTTSQSAGIITIPVVVHVIHSGQDIGIAPNITDAQVQSQITVMNEDYRKMINTPGFNTNPVGADTQIQFALAQQDPTGNPTNGIDRVRFCQNSWADTEIELTVKPATIWDPSQYMNMWSVDFSDNDILGYAQFPDASGLLGLDASGGNANTDGVVANYTSFGSINHGSFFLNAPYDKGRTMSHEVGHWLGLIHIWGDTTCGTDYCADTPVHHDSNFDCPTVVNCDANGNEMVENYMDYTDDACMNIFTQNQKDRMVVILNNAPRRSSLKVSTKNFPIPLFANDAEIKVENSCPTEACGTAQILQKITIYNRGTTTLTSATISYNINDLNYTSYNWTGNLATHKSDTFDIPISSAISGTINASITKANGVTDQRATNNTASGNFIPPVISENYTFNTFKFRLQLDQFGSETTWILKNSSDTILFSGGPYTDTNTLPTLITQDWTLADNECYTFTINDLEGDGICCDFGNGFYDISADNGNTIVFSGSTFTTSNSKTFSVNIDDTVIVGYDDFYIYPNPVKDILNIKTPSNLGILCSYKISNVLGQIIQTANVFDTNNFTINTASISSGAYFITFEKGIKKKNLRFIKQ